MHTLIASTVITPGTSTGKYSEAYDYHAQTVPGGASMREILSTNMTNILWYNVLTYKSHEYLHCAVSKNIYCTRCMKFTDWILLNL